MDDPLATTPFALESLANHVALPPRLPGKPDTHLDQIEHAVTVRLVNASRTLRDATNGELSHQWECTRHTLQTCIAVNAGRKLDKTSLSAALRRLERKDALILHVTEQNAGLLIQRQPEVQGEVVIFEAFEASPMSDKVLATKNALQWDFPGCAVAIPYFEFATDSFQENLAAFLEQASTESIKRFAARSNKAHSSAFESRDTVDPSLITQMLMTLLEANGRRVFPPLLRKRVRDDVCWTDGAEKPWRRSAYWLVLRVGIQRHLYTVHGREAGRAYYKFLLCLLLMRLLDDALENASPELLAFLKAKLARRLAKLEVDRLRVSPDVRSIYQLMFAALGPDFLKTMIKATERIETVWKNIKNSIRRPIPVLRRRAENAHVTLTLPNSGQYLQQVMSWHLNMNSVVAPFISHSHPNVSGAIATQFQLFANRYFKLSDLESKIEESNLAEATPRLEPEERCVQLATSIEKYLVAVADTYDSNPEQKSIMLLTVMELWTSMDQCASGLFKLLMDYNPGFSPEILDVVQLSRLTDMFRLRNIQEYLSDRITRCNLSRKTIFDDPSKGCFAERYFEESPDSLRLQELRRSIEGAAESARERKEEEWRRIRAEFEELERTIQKSTCLYTTEYNRVVHDYRNCTKCYLWRKSKRMTIHIHEDPLPVHPTQAKALLFELRCPRAFAAYRDATWKIMSVLAHQKQIVGFEPRMVLCDYSELKAFVNPRTKGVSLASTTKSFLSTHYKGINFPVNLDQVCLPHGLSWGYFDALTKAWPGRQGQKLTFAHHCQITIPAESPFSSLQFSDTFAADSNGPSSNEVIASQTRCPSGLNVHEYMAYQALIPGGHRLWPSILIELGSSNLNFSTEATMLLMSRLALQAGPIFESDHLRTTHRVLRDRQFCGRLMEQIDLRLDGICSNWHEIYCMEMLLTLILRLCSLTSEPVLEEALRLLRKARAATLNWVTLLRTEIHKSTSADVARKCSRYALWAALLCRRTFAIYPARDNNTESKTDIQPEDLECFIECSITLQDNLVGNPAALLPSLKNALIRDLKMVYCMRFVLRASLEANPGQLNLALNKVWPQSEGHLSRSFAKPVFLPTPFEWWVISIIDAAGQTRQQTIHYHLLEGNFLVDGQPVGKLPAEHRESAILEELFGKQALLTYPSGFPGMSYTLAFSVYGHQIHIGFRNKSLIVQACFEGTVMEFIPRQVFGDASNFDLPASLVENCVHWLDLRTGVVEIKQRPDIWIFKKSNWRLDLNSHTVRRRNSVLVDPHSPTFLRIARIFDRFEYRGRLTVFQPERGWLSVELPRLELSFFVNSRGLLECRQLRSEVDPDQDAGTWYGLNSKLVLRDVRNLRQRSMIVPMGLVKYTRSGSHVAVEVANVGDYGRYIINNVLGRLDCAAEPRLLYLKAHLHACTSFILADPLTGRTGTEEALHCLNSGYCQPWTALNPRHFQILMEIAKLTPTREYYPKDMKVMQRVSWNPDLTSTVQHDGFRPVVEAIFEQSKLLSTFALQRNEILPTDLADTSFHLSSRSYLRRQFFERQRLGLDYQQEAVDLPYIARGGDQACQARFNVFECVSLIRNRPAHLPTTRDLAGILQGWTTIGGYEGQFDQFLLSDLLDLEFATQWGSLVNKCRFAETKDMYRLMFLFSIVSFHADADMDIVRTLIAFTILESLKTLEPPHWPHFAHFRWNHVPTATYLTQLIKNCCYSYPDDERSLLHCSVGFKLRRKLEAAELAHNQQVEKECQALMHFLLEQWPCPEPTIEGVLESPLVDIPRALDIIRPEWLRLFQNIELSRHIEQVQDVLDEHSSEAKLEHPKVWTDDQQILSTSYQGVEVPTLSGDLLHKAGPNMFEELYLKMSKVDMVSHQAPFSVLEEVIPTKDTLIQVQQKSLPVSHEIHELEHIINDITESCSTVQQQYGRDLMQSLEALKTFGTMPDKNEESIIPAEMSSEILIARRAVNEQFNHLSKALEGNDFRARWLQEGGIWPCITPVTLLEQLRSTSEAVFGDGMKESLVMYALTITKLQRFMRVEDAYLKGNSLRLLEEQKNSGHGNWSPLKYPDWILLEIDANLLIRCDQVDVALATISPASGSNSVLQMNMGQGKTSCIMPMVAAVLADTRNLLRVVIPQSLLLQTAQLLQARLGALIGRTTSHIPFSRKTPTSSEIIRTYYDIHKGIRASSGVVVALPEHILSFMLSGLQRLSDAHISEATQMIKVQNFMRKVCRDVLDESDFTLAVRTQLIYPSGLQTTVDGHPHRWETAEALLRLVEGHLWNLQQDFPRSIDVIARLQGGFPVIFLLRKDVEDALIARLVKDIVDGQTSILPVKGCTKSDRSAIKQFISEASVRPVITERIRQLFVDQPAAKQNAYLLRGLLVHRILLLTLKKRWNVQYGLHPHRDPIAVPYHARGCPSESAEFGHPDVAILFTCLAFYFGGLDLAQLRQSIEHVLKSDDPSSEYDRWTNNTRNLPDSLREWNAINVDDEFQLREIWHHFRYGVVVIDYFLNHFVFPKHAKQFPTKLSASGWDIPLFVPTSQISTGQKSSRPCSKPTTTGFSGTNDNRTMLPLTIRQEDLHGLSHTNAEVLTYLLQRRNRSYVLASDSRGKHLSELDLLHMLNRAKIRMLIDAGAQILEMDNYSLVKTWLRVDTEAPAAVYFDAENKPFVLYRKGHQIPLLASPFADDLGDCLVYLDEAHTRGTDLKMPPCAVGALTLGLGQTKDHTVQAAMRLRQLATSQSVVFFAPPQVHQSILDLRKKTHEDVIDSSDVIRWLLEQTCSGIEQIQPLHFSHGVDYCRRTQAALDNPDFLVDAEQSDAYLEVLQEKEQRSLQQLYKPRVKSKSRIALGPFSPEIGAFVKELYTRRKGFQDTGNAVHGSALQEVEQEREVEFEAEAVREVQKPTHYLPLSFVGLHRDITAFVETGRLAAGCGGYEHAFVALKRTDLGLKYGISSQTTKSKMFLSGEFARTVKMPSGHPNRNLLRQVNWVLWSVVTDTALIIIPEEAELLIPRICDIKKPVTHLLTYAAPVTRKMLHFNNLTYYAMPALPTGWKPPTWLTIELGIFDGRLYFEFEEYSALRQYLGLGEDSAKPLETSSGLVSPTQPDWVDSRADETADEAEVKDISVQTARSFTAKPLSFLQEWLALKRKGQDFTHTPMGYVCQGKPLNENHPFFTRYSHDGAPRDSAPLQSNYQARAEGSIAADVPSGNKVSEDDGSDSEDEYGNEYFDQSELDNGESSGNSVPDTDGDASE